MPQNEYFYCFKQSPRREFDTAVVNAGMRVFFDDDSANINDITLVYGGVAEKTVFASKTMEKLKGKSVCTCFTLNKMGFFLVNPCI